MLWWMLGGCSVGGCSVVARSVDAWWLLGECITAYLNLLVKSKYYIPELQNRAFLVKDLYLYVLLLCHCIGYMIVLSSRLNIQASKIQKN